MIGRDESSEAVILGGGTGVGLLDFPWSLC